MLNIMVALRPELIRQPLFIIDKSQTVGRTSDRSDGRICTLTTTSRIWNFADGNCLSPGECLKLMGHDSPCLMRDVLIRASLGMSVHVSIAGMVLAGLITTIGVS